MNYKQIMNSVQQQLISNEAENETPQMEMQEYKNDFLQMNIGSLNAIMRSKPLILDGITISVQNVKTQRLSGSGLILFKLL